MPAGMYGADPEQLTALGGKLVAQNESIADIQTIVFTTLGGTTWQGPAREKFEADWNDQFNPALNGLKDAFTAAGNECTQPRCVPRPGDGRRRVGFEHPSAGALPSARRPPVARLGTRAGSATAGDRPTLRG